MPRLKVESQSLGSSRAADFLGIHRSTLTSWRRRGELRPTSVENSPRGRLYKFSIQDLEEFRERIDYDH